jgi:hypothetical protein
MDPTEVRQMVKHSQCVVIIDSAPPIKASYPPYAVRREKALAPNYGEPRLVSLVTAEEEKIERSAQVYRQKQLEAAVARVASGDVSGDGAPVARIAGVSERAAVAADSVYQEVFQRMVDGLLPEPCPLELQSQFAKLVKAHFDSGQITTWEEVRDLDLKVMRSLGVAKRGLIDHEDVELVEPGQQESRPAVDSSTIVSSGPVVEAAEVESQRIPERVVGVPAIVSEAVVDAHRVTTGEPVVAVDGSKNGGQVVVPPPPKAADSNGDGKKPAPDQQVLFLLSNDVVEDGVMKAATVSITTRARSEGGKRLRATTVKSYRGGAGAGLPGEAMVNTRRPSGSQDALR